MGESTDGKQMDDDNLVDYVGSGIELVVAKPLSGRKGDSKMYDSDGVHSLTRDTARIFEKKKLRMANVQKLRTTSNNPLITDQDY